MLSEWPAVWRDLCTGMVDRGVLLGWPGALCHGVWMVPVHGGWSGVLPWGGSSSVLERDKGIRWMPWHQEAMKDVARCEKPWGAASRR